MRRLASAIVMSLSLGSALSAPTPEGATVRPLAFQDLAGWQTDDHLSALRTFKVSCRAIRENAPELRNAQPAAEGLRLACQRAEAVLETAADAKAFFESAFTPFRVSPNEGRGFLTGYFEPEIEGALQKSGLFTAPVYGRPPDLVTLKPGEGPKNLDPALAAARQQADGLVPYPVRSEIVAGALAGQGLEILYLRDEPEVFIVQVQGSARIRLPDGKRMRLTYAGRNGHPYTSIGRMLIAEGHIPPQDMSLAKLMGWLRANPADAVRVMSANKSYVFFALSEDAGGGPIGGAGVALTTERSLAVDRNIWSYGLPIWCGADIDTLDAGHRTIARLMIAQDTGSAIVGPARADYFWGSGDEAGRKAGLTRHALDFVVLWPNDDPAP